MKHIYSKSQNMLSNRDILQIMASIYDLTVEHSNAREQHEIGIRYSEDLYCKKKKNVRSCFRSILLIFFQSYVKYNLKKN
jgi:hypothetical protein